MFLIRATEEGIIAHYGEDEMKTPMHMSMGSEAIAVGVCENLVDADQVLTSYRSHAVYLAKTDDVEGFFGEMYGRITGPNGGRAGSMHISNPEKGFMGASGVVGSHLPMGLGLAFANQYKVTDAISVVFFGDAALTEGVFWETLNAACAMKLPILFVYEDNGLSVETNLEVIHGFDSVANAINGFNIAKFGPATTLSEIWEQSSQAVAWARRGRPAFLHARYHRYMEHVGVGMDDPVRITEEEWAGIDPVSTERTNLLQHGVPAAVLTLSERNINSRIVRSILAAKAAEKPTFIFDSGIGPSASYAS